MAHTHTGVHDHGFNNVSTYGNLLRLMTEGAIPEVEWEQRYYALALKCGGAVQAARCPTDQASSIPQRAALALQRHGAAAQPGAGGQAWAGPDGGAGCPHQPAGAPLRHAATTSRFNVYFGEGRDAYDIRGRVVHESIFNTPAACRCASTQQGYSPFSTWPRARVDSLRLSGAARVPGRPAGGAARGFGGRDEVTGVSCAPRAADFYLEQTPADGIPYWDTGAPGLARMGDYLDRPADPYNEHEPVDSSPPPSPRRACCASGST